MPNFKCYCHDGLCIAQHTGSHKNSLNLLVEKYLNESHWPMRRIRLLECTHTVAQSGYAVRVIAGRSLGDNEEFEIPTLPHGCADKKKTTTTTKNMQIRGGLRFFIVALPENIFIVLFYARPSARPAGPRFWPRLRLAIPIPFYFSP